MNTMIILTDRSHSPRTGSILVVAVCTTAIIGVALLGYLQITSNQHRMAMRSQVWNACVPIAEAGIEEALTHCTRNFLTNLNTSGWELRGNKYVKENKVGTGEYRVTISKTTPFEINSVGTLPLSGGRQGISRKVRVITENRGVFSGAMILRSFVDLNGNDILVDSYDSRDSGKSTNQRYDPIKAGDKGDIACTTGIQNSTVKLGNANIWGKLFTGATATPSCGPRGAVGSVAWQRAGSMGIEPGWTRSDFNLSFPDVTPPFADGSGFPPLLGEPLGNTKYEIHGDWSGKIRVTGNAIAYVHGNIKFGSTDSLEIAPGASLKVYCAGASAVFTTIVNSNAIATNFTYYGLPSNRSVELKGSGSKVTGGIYAPQANIILSGGAELFGAIVGNSCTMNGWAHIHYDEALKFELPIAGFVVTRWDEL